MNKDNITDIFFDLDHTLWDFEKNSALTFKKILKENNIDVNLQSFLEVYIPQNLIFWKLYREEKITKETLRYERLKTVFDKINHTISDKMIHHLSNEYINHLSSFNHLFTGAVEVLEYLSPKYELHIITNGFQEIQRKKLENSNIHHFFKQVIDSEMAGVKKPNPTIFNLALDKANVLADKTLMIGDSLEADILGAQGAGMHALHFIAHNEPIHELCPIINNLNEIKEYL